MSVATNPSGSTPRAGLTGRVFLRVLLAVILVVLLLALGAIWYANTPRFERFLRRSVIAGLERATGGRVEMGTFQWSLLHLSFAANNLTIHGLEQPNEIPYLHVDRVYIRAKIISLVQHRIGLDYFEADHPVVHLIIYPDGTTNQPLPKGRAANKPVIDTIFDLKIARAEIRNGVAIVNQRATPFNAEGNNLGVIVTYVPASKVNGTDRYLGKIHLEDLAIRHGKLPEIHSIVDAEVDLARNKLNLDSLRLRTGNSELDLSGSVVNFSDPKWKFQAKGGVALEAVEDLTGVPGVNRGYAQIDLKGAGQRSNFEVDGSSKVWGATYHAGSIHLAGFSAQTRLYITRDELKLIDMQARLANGGFINGDMEISHWLHPSVQAAIPPLPPSTAPAKRSAGAAAAAPGIQRGTIHAHLHGLGLASIMAIVAPAHFEELGFDTEASGDATVSWAGSASAFGITANITLMPPLISTAGRVPMYGTVDAEYSNVSGLVDIHSVDLHTPASVIKVAGSLGVYPITRGSNLKVSLSTANLSEFDPALTTLGVQFKGKHGVGALPISSRGSADFTGTITDSILDPDVKGHLDASNFNVMLPVGSSGPRQIPWDSIRADAEYSSRRIAVADAILTRGPAKLDLSGELDAHRIASRRWSFDEESRVRANVAVENAAVQPLLDMTGKAIPVSGTLGLIAHASGTVGNLNGGGHLSIMQGTAYGEEYKSLNADLHLAGRELDVANLVFLEDGGKVVGNGGYNLKTEAFHINVQGTGFDLARIRRLRNAKYRLNGDLEFEVSGNGTMRQPNLSANLHLTRLNINKTLSGFVDAVAHTQGRTLLVSANAMVAGAQIKLQSQTQLAAKFDTRAQLTLASFNIEPVLIGFNEQKVTAQSSIGATVNVSGPLGEPRRMTGDATISQLSLSLAGVDLKSDGAIHATLANGRMHLDPLHITGTDTDLRAQGSIGAFTETHDISLQARGSVNLQLAQSFNSNIISSGEVNFDVSAQGTVARPRLKGDVRFANVSFALSNIPNGLSNVNGTLSFGQDRLDVKSLTAVSGGGKLTIGGFVSYQQGIYGDLTATATGVRIRYPQGVSTMVDAALRLQGTRESSLLSGKVTITRFAIISGLSLTSFNPTINGLSLPPNPNAVSNRVRLDMHIVSAPQLDFQNSYAKLAGDIDLRVRGTIGQPSILGHISITEGSATFAGTKYELQHGDIYFSNPVRIDPTLDLSATARVEDYNITVGLTGTASKPAPTFRSEPPLSEQDIFSLLALGRTQEEQQIYSNMQSQAGVNTTADALLGGALNATVSNRIQKLFGGGSVKIDPTFVTGTGNATARITVQQQVSKYATLTYATNVNSTAQQLIQAQINLTQNLSVLAVRDEVGVFSLIFKLRHRYR